MENKTEKEILEFLNANWVLIESKHHFVNGMHFKRTDNGWIRLMLSN